jgi:hypothetical protein
MTFDDLLIEFEITKEERAALVWHLAAFRARKTVDALSDDAEYQRRRKELLSVLRQGGA